MRKTRLLSMVFSILLLFSLSVGLITAQGPSPQAPVGSAFTYQGYITGDGSPIDGACDFRFSLWDALSAGNQVGLTLDRPTIPVGNGRFTVQLDFGPVFNGAALWLEIAVKCGDPDYTTLAPRQELTQSPYAGYSLSTGALQGWPVSGAGPVVGQALKWDGVTWSPAVDDNTTYGAGAGLILSGTVFYADPAYLQLRVSGACGAGFYMQQINADGSVVCQPDQNTLYSAGTGLLLTGTVFGADTNYLQRRVATGCGVGYSIQQIYGDGSVLCTVGQGGDITSVAAGPGLLGGGNTGAVTLTVYFAGSGTETRVARADHVHAGEDIVSGTVGFAYYSAHDDLGDEGYLSNNVGGIAQNNWLPQVGLNADWLDGMHASQFSTVTVHAQLAGLDADDHHQYFHLEQDEVVSGTPSFNGGGISGPPFWVDSSYLIPYLNSDLLDDHQGAFYQDAGNLITGTLDPARYSAYADLTVEGYLDNNAPGDLLTQSQGDGRFVNEGQPDSIDSPMIVDGSILFADLAPNGCINGEIPKFNGAAWTCAGDNDGSGTSWDLVGNAGTNPATNFLGTTDAQPLVVRTGNAERMRIDATGLVGIGTAPAAGVLVDVLGGTSVAVRGTSNNAAGSAAVLGINSGAGAGVRGQSTGTAIFGLGGMTGAYGSGTTYGVFGQGGMTAVYGSTPNANAYAVYGTCSGGTCTGVRGEGTSYGLYGLSGMATGTAVYANESSVSGSTYGVYTQVASGSGQAVHAVGGQYGVWASGVSTAVYGQGGTYGVWGTGSSTGVYGYSASTAVRADGGAYGVWADGTSTGVYSSGTYAVRAAGTSTGVWATGGPTGVYASGTSTSIYTIGGTYGLYSTGSSTGVYVPNSGAYGIYGVSNNAAAPYAGVRGDGLRYGVYGYATGASGGDWGVYGTSSSTQGGVIGLVTGAGVFAVRGSNTNGIGGYFWNSNINYYALYAYNAASSTGPGLYIRGNLVATGSKAGYVTDLCQSDDSGTLEPGDVVVVTGSGPAVLGSIPVMTVRKADAAYASGVIGIVDARQSVEQGEDPAAADPESSSAAIPLIRTTDGAIQKGDYLMVVTLGAYQQVKVDTSYGAIHPGDLLVASPNPGYAMKAKSVTVDGVPMYPSGTIIGKALGTLEEGTGLVPIYVTSH